MQIPLPLRVVLYTTLAVSAATGLLCTVLIVRGTRGPLVAYGGLAAVLVCMAAFTVWRVVRFHYSIEPDPQPPGFDVVATPDTARPADDPARR